MQTNNEIPDGTLILDESDIKSILTIKDVIHAVEDAFKLYAEGKTQMPAKVYLNFEKGDLRAMPALVREFAGVKWVNSHPNNREKGLPTVMALIILSSPETGFPLAVMDGTYITCMRTGAAGGIAAKYLAREDSSTFGFIGCGAQAYYQFEALNEIFEIEKVKIYDINSNSSKKFVKYCLNRDVNANQVDAKNACKCDVLTTTTPSRKPVVKNEWINDGIHINAIGADAPGKQELDEKILLRSKIIVDDFEQAIHGGEINVPISKGVFNPDKIYSTIGEIIAGFKPGRESYEEITVFDSTGLAIQDVATAGVVFKKFSQTSKKLSKKDVEKIFKFFTF